MSLFHSLFLSCRKATELMERATVSPLPIHSRFQLVVHKAACAACALFAKQSEAIDQLMEQRGGSNQGPDTARLEDRIIEALPASDKP
ncbi:MAG: hypothetical protein IPM12_02145 [Flavobacteriales bacterium]|nr:hypothetical protein [Flavobacteriales bacterium]